MATVLASAVEQYAAQQRLQAVGIAAARRAWRLGRVQMLVPTLTVLQRRAAADAERAVAAMVAEQNLSADPEGELVPSSLAGVASDGRPLDTLLAQAEDQTSLEAMVLTQVADAARVGQGVALTARPRLDGYVRYVNPPSCSRCAVLAGRFYRWSSGFLRHPRCDCVNVPSTSAAAPGLVSDPMRAFREGKITDLSGAQAEAIEAGADISRVVNATTRKGAVYTAGGRTFTREAATRRGVGRAVRLTPESIFQVAEDRADAIRLLGVHGYLR